MTQSKRHYGMDWLRVGAFGLLIFYHIGMFFVPWPWHAKTAESLDWVAVPMLATSSWRLALLFVVSGYASAIMLAKGRGSAGFARERTARLMIPVLAGMILFLPPQPWVELVSQHGFTKSFGAFWIQDYFRFSPLDGVMLPTWQHLWFVVYLWVYTLALALIVGVARIERVQPVFERLFAGPGLFLFPIGWALMVSLWLLPGARATHDLTDAISHATYIPAFLFGVGLAHAPAVLDHAGRWWKPAALVAVASYAVVAAMEIAHPGFTPIPQPLLDLFRASRGIQGWTAIVALIGIAHVYLNHDRPWRATLTQAVFPFYIIHQTIIVVFGWWLLRFGLHPGVEFVLILAATVLGCWIFYDVGRRFGWIRPLIGLKYERPVASAR